MRTFIVLVIGMVIGVCCTHFFHHWLGTQQSEQSVVERESKMAVPEVEISSSTIVEGDVENVPWQKEIYELYQAIENGDLYGNERVDAQRRVDDYSKLCLDEGADLFPFIRQQKVNKLHCFFSGIENFKDEIKQFEETDNGYYLALLRLTYDEDRFFAYTNREYYQFLVDDLDDGIVGWDKTRQKLASDLFDISDSISDKGFYRYIGENFDRAVSTQTYQKFWRLGWPKRPE